MAGRAFALAGAARLLARRDRDRRRLCAAAGAARGHRAGAARVAGPRVSRLQSDDPAQAGGAAGGRPRRPARRAASARSTRSSSRPTAASTPATPISSAFARICAMRARLEPDGGPGRRARRRRVARAVVAALGDAGVGEIRLVNRTRSRAEAVADDLATSATRISVHSWDAARDVLDGAGLLVNTTSLGMTGEPPLDLDLSPLPRSAPVVDIVYVPLETGLLAAARRRGHPVVDGLGMLLHQGRPGFEAWFGAKVRGDAGAAGGDRRDPGARNVIVVGLTGSIGMGKSTAAAMLRRMRRAAVRRRPGGSSAAGAGRRRRWQRSRRRFPACARRTAASTASGSGSASLAIPTALAAARGNPASDGRRGREAVSGPRPRPPRAARRARHTAAVREPRRGALRLCDRGLGTGDAAAPAGDAPAGHDRGALCRDPEAADARRRKTPARGFRRADRAWTAASACGACGRSSAACAARGHAPPRRGRHPADKRRQAR